MKNILTIIIAIVLLGCSHFEEMNTNPTISTKPDPESLVTSVQLTISGKRYTQWRYNFIYGMGTAQIISDGWSAGHGQKYIPSPAYLEAMWDDHYIAIANLISAENEVKEDDDMVNHFVIANTMKNFIFLRLTDYYGDIPYSEAGKGYTEQIFIPKYDKQEDIYSSIFKELDNDIQLLENSSSPKPFNGDIFFNGDMSKWKRFINTIRLRMALRLVHIKPELAKSQAQKAIESGIMNTNDDNIVIDHESFTFADQEIRGNGLSQVFFETLPRSCDTYINELRKNNDPRLTMILGVYGAPAELANDQRAYESFDSRSIDVTQEFGKYEGFPPGYFTWDDIPGFDWSTVEVIKDGNTVLLNRNSQRMQFRREFVDFNAPYVHLTASEALLMEAEANVRWGIGREYSPLVKEAVEMHYNFIKNKFNAHSVNNDIGTFIGALDIQKENALQIINEQIYILNYFNGTEAINNWKRSGFPLFEASFDPMYTDPQLNGLIPRRLIYPMSETLYNTNVSEAISNTESGTNFWGNPIWWDTDKTRGIK